MGTLVRIMVIAGSLALYDVFLKPVFKSWVEGRGEIYGFGPAFLAYMAVVVAAFVAAHLVSRRLDEDG